MDPDDTYTILTEQMKVTNPQLSTLHDSSPSGLSAAKCYSTLLISPPQGMMINLNVLLLHAHVSSGTLACPNKCSGHGCCDSDTGLCSCDGGFKGGDCGTDVCKPPLLSRAWL
jgi:hypothetical protein